MKRLCNKFLTFSIITFICLFINLKVQGQDDNRMWLHYFNSVKINDKWSVNSDAAYMFMFDKPIDRIQVRSGLKYKFTKNFSFRAGLGYFYVFGKGQENINEIRPMQDFIGTHYLSKDRSLYIKQRARFEQQIYRAKFNEGETDDINYRMRYSFIIRKKIENWIFGIGTEAFINFVDKSTSPFFNKNRSIALVNRKINDQFNLEVQYIREDKFSKDEGSVHYSNIVRIAIRHSIL